MLPEFRVASLRRGGCAAFGHSHTSICSTGADELSQGASPFLRKGPEISVCMPVSRDTEFFRKALTSVLEQTREDFELIVSDDSGGKLARYVASVNDKRIIYTFNASPLGFAANHCLVLSRARGKYVAILHDDDVWEPQYLLRASTVLEQHSDVGIVLAGAVETGPNGEPLGARRNTMRHGIQADPLSKFLHRDFMMLLPSLSVFRQEALRCNTRPWPDVIAADLTMYVDAVRAGWNVYYLDEPLVRYRIHPHQIGTNDLAHRHALVTVWNGYAFPDRRHEALRRKRVSEALVERAGAYLRLNASANVRDDLLLARRIDSRAVGLRWLVLLTLSFCPIAIPTAIALWSRLQLALGGQRQRAKKAALRSLSRSYGGQNS